MVRPVRRSKEERKNEGGAEGEGDTDEEKTAAERAAYEASFPDGGRGWVVVGGCALYSATTVGWGCVLVLPSPSQYSERADTEPHLAYEFRGNSLVRP